MTDCDFYKLIYSRLGNLTPIAADCGRLCNAACCQGDRDGDGMYLFPNEENVLGDVSDWADISETDFEYEKGKYALLLSCDGVCQRKLRPLSCRIFPLTPYVEKNGELNLIVDPRGRGMCPMSALKVEDFQKEFVNALWDISKIMMKNTHCKNFIESFSRMIDETQFKL